MNIYIIHLIVMLGSTALALQGIINKDIQALTISVMALVFWATLLILKVSETK